MNSSKLKRQLRLGGWASEARNLERRIASQGLPLQVGWSNAGTPSDEYGLRIRIAQPDEVDDYDRNQPPLIAVLMPEGRVVATENTVFFNKPRKKKGRQFLMADGLPMGPLTIRLSNSLRERLKDAYPGESLGQVIRELLDAHLRTIGR